jgi:hypothetical protein
MSRFLALLIAVLLPLQLAWGAAASYCQHETSVAASAHFGHHSHVHSDAQPDGKSSALKLQIDADCTACHAAFSAVLPELAALTSMPGQALIPLPSGDLRRPSAPQRTPDRPQWPRLA